MKKAATNALLLLSAVLLAFGVGEIAVRALMADTTVLFPRYHTDYRYGPYVLRGIRPGETFRHSSIDGSWQFVTNSKGFRDTREFSYAKPPGTFRVLALGDSHTQGYEVRQDATYSAVLERQLARAGRPAEVINAGVSGFSTAEALAFLEHEGHRYQPDVVVLGFFANDFEDNFKAGLFTLDPRGQLVEARFEHIPGVRIQNAIYALPGIKWLGENSHFYSLLFNTAWVFFKYRPAETTAQNVFEIAVPTRRDRTAEEIALAAALVERMQRFCVARGIRLIVADIPTDLGRFEIESSMPPAFRARLDAAGVEFVPSELLFDRYAGAVELHLPHGYHHISEFSHARIGVEIGQRIAAPSALRPAAP